MTRINAGIRASELCDVHLRAEHREIKRIPNRIRKGRFSMTGQPEAFTLGTGHEKFFYDKLLYLFRRYKEIHEECKARGFQMTDFSDCWADLPDGLMNDWPETPEARALLQERIQERYATGMDKRFTPRRSTLERVHVIQ